MDQPLAVYGTLERYVYEVRSEKRPLVRYRVDVVANGGAGRCACTDFCTRRQPAIDRGEPILTRATTCKHLRQANHVFHCEIHRGLARVENEEASA